MDKVGVRFAGDRYINVELDPETKKATITAVLGEATVAGTVTLTAAKAEKMGVK